MKSIWHQNLRNYSKLNENIERDIVIIGGGISGLLTAYELKKRGLNVTVVEGSRLLSGSTENTTAKITFQQGLLYHKLESSYNLDFAKSYYESQFFAMEKYAQLVNSLKLSCDLQRVPSFVFTTEEDENLEKETETLTKLGAKPKFLKELPEVPLPIYGAVSIEKQLQFDPVAFLKELPKNFEIYEDSRVVDFNLDEKVLYTEKGKIKAKKLIFATRYPLFRFENLFFMKMHQSRSYAVACPSEKLPSGIYLDNKIDGLSIRSHRDKVIVGGCDHRKMEDAVKNCFSVLEGISKELFYTKSTAYRWTAEDCMTYDGVPYVGRLPNYHNVYVITGFNKWGMTNAMNASELISDLITEKDNPYEEIFSLKRGVIRRHLWLFLRDTGVSIKNLVLKGLLLPIIRIKYLPKDSAGVVMLGLKRQAVYRDKEGNLHIFSAKCTHLGCELQWNENTKTWDCPCHGSRFDIDGKVLDAPACKNGKQKIEKKEETDEVL